MEAARSRARRCVQEFVAGWLAGDDDMVSHACTPDVRWWTPVSGETTSGPAAACAELRRVLPPMGRPVEVTAVVLDDDGSRCVVELRCEAGDAPVLITSVLTLLDGRVSAGRTYVDTKTLENPALERSHGGPA